MRIKYFQISINVTYVRRNVCNDSKIFRMKLFCISLRRKCFVARPVGFKFSTKEVTSFSKKKIEGKIRKRNNIEV